MHFLQADEAERDDQVEAEQEEGHEMDSAEVAEQVAADDYLQPQQPQPEVNLPDEFHLDGSGSDMDEQAGEAHQDGAGEHDADGDSDAMDTGELLHHLGIDTWIGAVSVGSSSWYSIGLRIITVVWCGNGDAARLKEWFNLQMTFKSASSSWTMNQALKTVIMKMQMHIRM